MLESKTSLIDSFSELMTAASSLAAVILGEDEHVFVTRVLQGRSLEDMASAVRNSIRLIDRAAAAARIAASMEKIEEGKSRLGEREPYFLLRGQDAIALFALEKWIKVARKMGVDQQKIQKAEAECRAFERFRPRKLPD